MGPRRNLSPRFLLLQKIWSIYSIRWMEWSALQADSEFMASTRGATSFLKSVVHCTDHMAERGKKDAAHIASNVISVVNEFWYLRCWQLVRNSCSLSVISASSCKRNWSAHRHIHTKIRNKLGPETTETQAERFAYVYSNSKIAATIRDADELKMFAWDSEDV